MSKGKERAQKYLEQNKEVKEVHVTSDGFPFLQKQSAFAHAKTLENKEVETVNRSAKTEKSEKVLTEAEKVAAKVDADKKAASKKVAAAKKKADAKKKETEKVEKASQNTTGAKKNPANTGADQKTAK